MGDNIDWTTLWTGNAGEGTITLSDSIYNYKKIRFSTKIDTIGSSDQCFTPSTTLPRFTLSALWGATNGFTAATIWADIESSGRTLVLSSDRHHETSVTIDGDKVKFNNLNRYSITKIEGLK